jgi:hypothetical protein
MALSGLKTNTEFLPSIRFNAREGVFSRVDRSLDAEGKWANELVNINDPLATEGVLMDITNIHSTTASARSPNPAISIKRVLSSKYGCPKAPARAARSASSAIRRLA